MNKQLQDQLFAKNKKNDLNAIKNYLKNIKYVKEFKIINVVGTNGKGSLSTFIAQGIKQERMRVGLFTSPHIFDITERIKINNKKIPTKILEKYIKKHINLDTSFFTVLYLAAMEYFRDNNCDYVVLEAGIGGELDSTNAIDGEFGVVTSIGLDHTEFLGTTKNEIAQTKAGIINNNMIFFAPSWLPNEILEIFKEKCEKNNAKFLKISIDQSTYPQQNKLFAEKILNFIFKKNKKYFFHDLFGRCTIFQLPHGGKIILDVSHNLEGFEATVKLLRWKKVQYENVVISLSSTKDDEEIEKLFPNKNIFLYQNHSFKAKSIDDYKIKGIKLKTKEDLVKIINEKSNTLFIGSFYFLPEIYPLIKGMVK